MVSKNGLVSRGTIAAFIGCFAIAVAPQALAQQQPPLAPIPKDCHAPGAAVVMPSALPNIATALKDRKHIKILAIGATSIAQRDGASGGYHAIIEQLLESTFKGVDVEVFNRGVSGELARDAAQRIKTEVALTGADLVLWQLGTADAMAQMSISEFKVTVTEAVVWLRQHNVDIALIGMHYARGMVGDPHYQAIRAVVRDIAGEHGILKIGRYEAVETIERNRREQGDPASAAELSEAGYVCMAEYLARALAVELFAKEGIRK